MFLGDVLFTIKEKGFAADFFYQFFREDDPVSKTARENFISNFPLLFGNSISSDDSKNNNNNNNNNDKNKNFFDPLVHHESNNIAKILKISVTTVLHYIKNISIRPNNKLLTSHLPNRWQIHINNLLLQKKWNFYSEENITTIIIILYFSLLILLSMPPALLQKGNNKNHHDYIIIIILLLL